MTVNQLIEKVDRLRPNQVTAADKLQWVVQLEELIWREIIHTHEDGEETEFTAPSGTDDLTAPAAYEEMYRYWLEAQIAFSNEEIERYNNAAQAFGEAFKDFRNWYNREHMPSCHNRWLRFL